MHVRMSCDHHLLSCDVQACRGGKFDYGVESETTDGPGSTKPSEDQMKEIVEKQVSTCVV